MKNPVNGITMKTERDANYDSVTVTKYFLDSKEVTREEYEAVYPPPEGVPMTGGAWSKPLLSDALAVHPTQVDEANARNAARGCSVTYDRADGRARIPDRAERKKLLKIEGMHDKDGGYSD